MTNSIKHGRAKNISININREKDHIKIMIEDDGSGAEKVIEGYGLKGMSERLDEVNGCFDYGSKNKGFFIKALKNELLHALSQNTLVFSELDSDKIADRRIKEMLTSGIRLLEPLSMEYTVFIDANGYIMEKNINLKSKLYYPKIDM